MTRPRPARPRALLVAAMAAGAAHAAALAAPPPVCRVEASGPPPLVIELYTSEGCSSCPPADRWLSTLAPRRDVIALGFHVTYWDRLGWPDRFAEPAYTERQWAWAKHFQSTQVYTPQVIVDGRDWRRWPALPAPPTATATATARAASRAAHAPPALQLHREGGTVVAALSPLAQAPGRRLEGYWAVVEDGHSSRVRAGENAGETLKHDHVVRLLQPVPAWPAREGLTSRLAVSRGVAAHPRRVVFVVVDPATRAPVQAAALAC